VLLLSKKLFTTFASGFSKATNTMLITSRKNFIILILFSVLFITACDFSSQNVGWEAYGTYKIEGPVTSTGASISTPITAGPSADAYFYVEAFTTEKDYQWSVESEQPSEVIRKGEMFRVTFEDAGSYTITVEAGAYQGETSVEVINSN